MTITQPALDGTVPESCPDFDAWVEQVRPAFERAAATGREFASWQIKVSEQLPDPPNPRAQWGILMHTLREEGLVYQAGWTSTRDGSGVRLWRGVPQARRRAA